MLKITKSIIAFGCFIGIASAAHAATSNAFRTSYFDETGTLVGQKVLYCNNYSVHGGNLHTAYSVTEEVACGSNEAIEPIVAGTEVTSYTLPGSVSITSACQQIVCLETGAQVRETPGVAWTWSDGLGD